MVTAGTVEDMELQEWRGVEVGPGRHVSLVCAAERKGDGE